jgi:hypothetical protein
METDIKKLSDRLSKLSQAKFTKPAEISEWPATLSDEWWFFSPEMISIAGTETFAQLSPAAQRRLSFCELINFFSLNIHGESSMMAGIAQRLYARKHADISAYLHHFLDEENKHSHYFGNFCLKYAGQVYPERKLVFPRQYAPGEEDFLFFAKIVIFEEIVDHYNVLMGHDDRLHPLVASIHRMHHSDESRHLAFGRSLTAALFARYCETWSAETLANVRAYLANYLIATFREYHSFDAYQDAQLPQPLALVQSSFDCAASAARRRVAAKRCVGYLLKNGILTEDPLS